MAILTSGDAGITPLVCSDPKKEDPVDFQTPAETAALREIIQRLERDLEDARAREARLFLLLEQLTRGLAPRKVAQSPPAAREPSPLSMRQRIRDVLENSPGWMKRVQIEAAVGTGRPLGNTLQKMAKLGLILSDTKGSYRRFSDPEPTSAQESTATTPNAPPRRRAR
jgi:hypothetical protein